MIESNVKFIKNVTLCCERNRDFYSRREFYISCGTVLQAQVRKNDNSTFDLVFPDSDVAAQVPSSWIKVKLHDGV